MFKLFVLCLPLLFYFWYFYHSSATSVPKPTSHLAPPQALDLSFLGRTDTFTFTLNARPVWSHVFADNYIVHKSKEKIFERNACYQYIDETKIDAKDLSLYQYVQNHPEFSFPIKEDSHYSAQQDGNIFYFVCRDRDIVRLEACPSGTFFQHQECIEVSSCAGKPNGTRLPIHSSIHKYYECKNFRPFTKNCPPNSFFYHDRCIREEELVYYCQVKDTVPPLRLNNTTLIACRDRKPVHEICEPGTKMFETLVCEPTDCVGRADNERLPLPTRRQDPFHFVPGYMECFGGKVVRTEECASDWDVALAQGDNLTMLPMVFQGRECAVPTFCENVFADDPSVMVPVYEFSRHVQNWALSKSYDRSAGYVCAGGRKRQSLDPGMRISKRFKAESACDQPGQTLSIDQRPDQYYDCDRRQTVTCGPGQFYNGRWCAAEPPHAFKFRGVPLFTFDPLNDESWIIPWNFYARNKPAELVCRGPDYHLQPLYNTCIHTDCAHYSFLSILPTMTMLLPPQQERALCKLDRMDKHIKKVPVPFDYTFWDQQKLMVDYTTRDKGCTFGQRLQSGNFIWDSTVWATCDPTQPFVFCPSARTTHLLHQNNVYACAPPPSNVIRHTMLDTNPHPWTSYATNEVKRIISTVPEVTRFFLNKRDKVRELAPFDTFDIPTGVVLTLKTSKPVDLELRYHVTYPHNVAFQYDDTNQRTALTSDSKHAFLVTYNTFTKTMVNFPTFQPKMHVSDFLAHP